MEIGSSAYRQRRDSITSSMLSGESRSIFGKGIESVFAFGYNAVKNRAFFVVQFAVPLSDDSRLVTARKGFVEDFVGGCYGDSPLSALCLRLRKSFRRFCRKTPPYTLGSAGAFRIFFVKGDVGPLSGHVTVSFFVRLLQCF